MKHKSSTTNSHSSQSHQTPGHAASSKGVSKRSGSSSTAQTPYQLQQQRLTAEVEALAQRLEHEATENCRLRSALTYLEAGLALLDQEQAGIVRQNFAGRSTSMSGAPTSTLSVWALPHPIDWDAAFEERVRAMSSLDLVVLHRQWLQELAMLLPRAQLHGPTSNEHARMLQLMDTYTYFNHNAMVLAPEAWEGKASYNLETMQRGQVGRGGWCFVHAAAAAAAAPQKHRTALACLVAYTLADMQCACPPQVPPMSDVLNHCRNSCATGMARTSATIQRYLTTAAQLNSESVQLASHTKQLLQLEAATSIGRSLPPPCQPSRSSGDGRSSSSGGSSSYTTDDVHGCKSALQDTLTRLQANLWRHRMALRQCLHAVWQGLREECPIEVASAYVTTYPLVLDLVHLVDAAATGL